MTAHEGKLIAFFFKREVIKPAFKEAANTIIFHIVLDVART